MGECNLCIVSMFWIRSGRQQTWRHCRAVRTSHVPILLAILSSICRCVWEDHLRYHPRVLALSVLFWKLLFHWFGWLLLIFLGFVVIISLQKLVSNPMTFAQSKFFHLRKPLQHLSFFFQGFLQSLQTNFMCFSKITNWQTIDSQSCGDCL